MVLLGIILFLLIVALTVLAAVEAEGVGILCGIFVMAGIVLFSTEVSDESYKQGQVDALTGKVKYELVVNADSTKTWEEVK
jgi:hypothetical protein